ncbi:hypothetical protein GALMADRAFT_138129 [Galerina marginata CBS 339.88]|uniref:Uncharacterized protein n=1 Tax=Galerina marginata (strain CBS 339.88) TaxID=685588 RepID=A0A067TDM2_GALM3|nr:hypothetical protein GALMADRAFT_138129 [Galerina marginata CBS 339.88]
MYANNPYAQAGWYNPQNPYSINNRPWCPNTWHTPTFGVLPRRPNGPSSVLTFEFTSPVDVLDVLNCIVIGPKQLKFFNIQTDSSVRSTTVSKPTEAFAEIRWNQYPMLSTIEAKCALPLQPAGDFLRPTPDQMTMLVNGKSYTWIACQRGTYVG